MRFCKSGLSGSYDPKRDVLYIYYEGREYSYGSEINDRVVVVRSIDTDKVTGYLIYDFKQQILEEKLSLKQFDYIFRCVINELGKEL